MDHNGIYCSASTKLNSKGPVVASVRLPILLDLTKDDYELGVQYISMVPTWMKIPDLWFVHKDSKGIEDYTHLDKIAHASKEEVLTALSNSILEKFGGNMKEARIKILKDKNVWYLRLQPKSSLQLSSEMALILGIDKLITNTGDTVKDFFIVYRNYDPFMETSLYYISCDQCEHNFINSSGVGNNMLDFIHLLTATKSSTVEHSNYNIKYSRLEGCLLNRLSFTLYNHASAAVISNSVDLFLIFHIRKINNA
jgi:hypothetical protein